MVVYRTKDGSALTEEELIQACIKRDSRAEQLLWDRYSPRLFGVCLRYCRTRAEAEEVLQEGFIKIFDRLRQFREKGSFEAWMRTIMIHTALTHLRLTKKYTAEMDVTEKVDLFLADTDPLRKLEGKDLMALIKTLPEPQQTILNLFSVDGYPHAEIAGMLQISEASSRVLLHRAKALLLQKLDDQPQTHKRYGNK